MKPPAHVHEQENRGSEDDSTPPPLVLLGHLPKQLLLQQIILGNYLDSDSVHTLMHMDEYRCNLNLDQYFCPVDGEHLRRVVETTLDTATGASAITASVPCDEGEKNEKLNDESHIESVLQVRTEISKLCVRCATKENRCEFCSMLCLDWLDDERAFICEVCDRSGCQAHKTGECDYCSNEFCGDCCPKSPKRCPRCGQLKCFICWSSRDDQHCATCDTFVCTECSNTCDWPRLDVQTIAGPYCSDCIRKRPRNIQDNCFVWFFDEDGNQHAELWR